MKRILIVAALAAAACGRSGPPVIASFTADKNDVQEGTSVVLSWVIRGANKVTLTPSAPIAGSSATVTPSQTTTYQLKAENEVGAATQDLTVNVTPRPRAARVAWFLASPSQVPAGSPVVLKWSVFSASRLELIDPGGAVETVTDVAQKTVTPASTGSYKLRATGTDTTLPPVERTAIVRVAPAPAISSFAASPTTPSQGQAVTLSWDGTGVTSWTLTGSDGMPPRSFLKAGNTVVRPQVATTYTLTASGPGGSTNRDQPVMVTSSPGTSFDYAQPTGGAALKLVADACPPPCTALKFHLTADSLTAARGVAVNLPIDGSKVSVDPAMTFFPGFAGGTGKVVLGRGPLQDVLVIAAAIKGAGGAPAADVNLSGNRDIATFTLNLVPAGGAGVAFSAPAPTAFEIRSSSTPPSGIAVGTLTVQ